MTTDEPMPCERCGEAHARCRAHRRDGKPCTQRPMHGQQVCKMHGGMTPGAREAAEQRQAEARADKVLRQLWTGLDEVTPVTDPVLMLTKLAGALKQMVDVVGGRVNDLGSVAGGEHLTQLRGEVVLLERLLSQLRQVSTEMARLNLDERQVRLAERHARWVVGAAESGWEQLGVFLGQAAVELPAEAREVFMRAFVAGLRSGGPGALELEAGAAS